MSIDAIFASKRVCKEKRNRNLQDTRPKDKHDPNLLPPAHVQLRHPKDWQGQDAQIRHHIDCCRRHKRDGDIDAVSLDHRIPDLDTWPALEDLKKQERSEKEGVEPNQGV